MILGIIFPIYKHFSLSLLASMILIRIPSQFCLYLNTVKLIYWNFFKSISSFPPDIYISTALVGKRQYFTDQVKSVSFDRCQCLLLRRNLYQMTVFQYFYAYAVSKVFIQLFAFSVESRSNFDTESSGSV